MFDRLKKLFLGDDSGNDGQKLVERLEADECRIAASECYDMTSWKIEGAIRAGFRSRLKVCLGYDPLSASVMEDEAVDYAKAKLAGRLVTFEESRAMRLTYLAKREGLNSSFASICDLEAAVIEQRVIAIATREGLDVALATEKGLSIALMRKHSEEIRQEQSGTSEFS